MAPGVYILENTPSLPGEGKTLTDVIWGKNVNRGREKGGNAKQKVRKGKKKDKGEEKGQGERK
jgi:hypothetical protein